MARPSYIFLLVDQQRLYQNALIAGSILAVFLLVSLYRGSQSRKKSKRLLNVQTLQLQKSSQQLTSLSSIRRKLLAEKEGLLKEVHHRVRNNLQIVISLLNMQTKYLKDDKTLSALGDISNRMYAISLIHQNLYVDDDITVIHMREYIRQLIKFLQEGTPGIIRVVILEDVGPIDLDISQSVSVGLLINEAITCTVKYAQEMQKSGLFLITMKETAYNKISLTLTEEGIDLPEQSHSEETPSLGYNLVKLLTAKLDGDLQIDRRPGLSITVSFRREAIAHEMAHYPPFPSPLQDSSQALWGQ